MAGMQGRSMASSSAPCQRTLPTFNERLTCSLCSQHSTPALVLRALGVHHMCEGLCSCSMGSMAKLSRCRDEGIQPGATLQRDPQENIWCGFKCTHNIYLKYRL